MLLAIVADDLTGALDSTAPFASRGMRSAVAVSMDRLDEALAREPSVLAINTASREIPATEARSRVSALLAQLPEGVRLFKKVDSRLKGNVEAELSAFGAQRLSVMPAIPEFGRIVTDGRLTGFGIETPVDIAGRLGSLAALSDIPDTTSTAEMRAALGAVPRSGVLVGARGLADALADSLAESVPKPVIEPGRRLVMAIGSRDPITLEQVDVLRARFPDAVYRAAPNGVLDRDVEDHGHRAPLSIVQAVPGNLLAEESAVSSALAHSLRHRMFTGHDGMLVSGGATAQAILEELDIGVLDVLGEIVDGLPVSRAQDLTIISKSGGFGMPDALVDVAMKFGATSGKRASGGV